VTPWSPRAPRVWRADAVASFAVTSTLLCAVQVTGPGLREPASGHASDPMRLGLTCWGFAPASQARGSSLPRQRHPAVRCAYAWRGPCRLLRPRLAGRAFALVGLGWPRGLATRFEVWPPGSGSGYRSPLEEHKEASHSKDPPLLTVRRHFKRPEAPRSAPKRSAPERIARSRLGLRQLIAIASGSRSRLLPPLRPNGGLGRG
jgi:hypothetical protein